MTRPAAWLIAGAAAALACTPPPPPGQAPPAREAAAEMRDAAGVLVGHAEFASVGTAQTRVTLTITATTPGNHGAHLHAVGQCVGPAFTTAGGHINPAGHQHGQYNPLGPHAGDLPNLRAVQSGTGAVAGGTLTYVINLPMDSLLDADGSAVIVHALGDDQVTDPAGNSGARIYCGVITAATGRRSAP